MRSSHSEAALLLRNHLPSSDRHPLLGQSFTFQSPRISWWPCMQPAPRQIWPKLSFLTLWVIAHMETSELEGIHSFWSEYYQSIPKQHRHFIYILNPACQSSTTFHVRQLWSCQYKWMVKLTFVRRYMRGHHDFSSQTWHTTEVFVRNTAHKASKHHHKVHLAVTSTIQCQ